MDKPTQYVSTELPAPLRVFARLTVLFTLASWIFSYTCHVLGLPKPFSWPYYDHDFGSDFSSFQQRFHYFHTAAFFHFDGPVFLYPAPLAVCYHVLFALWGYRPHSIRVFEALVLCIAAAATLLFVQALRRRGVSSRQSAALCLIALAFSYPLYFDVQRGNVEVIVWATLMGAFWALRKDKLMLAAVLFGVAIAFKWYPVILLGLFLYPRRYRAIPVAVLTACGVTALSNWWLGPDIRTAFIQTTLGMSHFVEMYAKHNLDLGYDHSCFAAFKFLALPFVHNLNADYSRYLALAAVSATALYFLRVRALPAINQISILLILSIALPPVSYDYTLLHLYICWAIFALYLVDRARAGRAVPQALWIMAWFAFTMAPHSYIIHHGQRYAGQAHFAGLVALLYIFFKHPFPEAGASHNAAVFAKEPPVSMEGTRR